MASYRFTNKAIADLSDIWNYTYENMVRETSRQILFDVA